MDDRSKVNGFGKQHPILEAIARKCALWDIEAELDEEDEEDPDEPAQLEMAFPEDALSDGSPGFTFHILAGPHARFALDAPFERYRKFRIEYRGPYTAIWSVSLGSIECELTPCNRLPGAPTYGESHHESVEDVLLELGYDLDTETLDPEERVWFETNDGATISIGPASNSFVVMTDSLHNATDGKYHPRGEDLVVRRDLTLRLEGVELPNESRAEELLEQLGNSALFGLDRTSGIGLRLASYAGRKRRRENHSAQELAHRITTEYDREPMSLYWYARSAEEGLPLLAFLAYYQVLEFYFPQYSRKGALQTLRESLRGLSLDSLRDADLAKVLEVVRTGRKGSFGNEIEQLKATVKQCIDQEMLRSFFEESDERKQFYGSDDCTRLSPTRIPIGGSSEDWRGDVARRVYEIRNRVVHAKSQHDDLEPLLPFDPEAQLLWHDVELVAFLAREVLYASARPLRNVASG